MWVLNGQQMDDRPAAVTRTDRYSVELFDAFIAAVDENAG